jgi:hypothetical protein
MSLTTVRPSTAADDARAAALLTQARAALGSDQALAQVRGLSASGTVQRMAGGARIEGELTLQIALPDRMLRSDSISPAGDMTLVTEQGINGDTLLRSTRTINAPAGAMVRTPPPPARGSQAEAQAVRNARAELTRLVLALLLTPPASTPLAFTYAGEAEAPDGRADVIDATSRSGGSFAARLFLDKQTHRPLMLTYRGVAPRLVMQTQRIDRPPAGVRPQHDGLAPLPPGEVVDIQLFLDDYRPVDAVLLPHRLTRAVAGETSEEWTITSFRINPAFKPDTFTAK